MKSPVSRQNIEQSSAAGRPLLSLFFPAAADLLLLNPKYDFKPTPANMMFYCFKGWLFIKPLTSDGLAKAQLAKLTLLRPLLSFVFEMSV